MLASASIFCATDACISGHRLGRMLMLADLRPCRWNLFPQPLSWFDLFVEWEGALPPDDLLAEWRSVGEPGEFAPLTFPKPPSATPNKKTRTPACGARTTRCAARSKGERLPPPRFMQRSPTCATPRA